MSCGDTSAICVLSLAARTKALGRTLPWPSLSRGIPFAVYIFFVVITPWLAPAFPEFDPRWFYAFKVGAVAVSLFLLRHHYTELLCSRPVRGVPEAVNTLLAVVVGATVFLLWIHLDHPWLTVGAVTGFDARASDGTLDWRLSIVRLVGTALVVPIMEELFWRSWIMRRLDCSAYWTCPPQAITLRALFLSSLVFGLEHRLWFAGVLAGLAYGSVYRYSGNLRTPVIAHAVTNLLLGLWVLETGNWQFW